MSDQFTQPADVVRRSQLKTINSESLIGSGNIVIPAGDTGPAGADGDSAYEIAVANGFVGDEAAWLASLVGATGATGATGPNEVTTATATNINAILRGDGSNVAAVSIGSGLSFSGGELSATGGGGGNSFATIQPQIAGTNGTAVVADSTSDTLTVNANCGAVITGDSGSDTLTLDCIGVPMIAWQAGSVDYYLTSPSATYGVLALTANRKYLSPIIFHRRMTITSARIAVTVAGTGSMTRFGLRRVNIQNGQPTTLVADFGEVDTSTTGIKAITGLTQVVDPGFYYLEIVSSGTPTIRSAVSEIMGANMSSGGFFAMVPLNGLFRAFTYAALPADESSQTQTETLGQSPIFMIRYT